MDDDLQVDGPGETDNEAEDSVPLPPKQEVKPEPKPEVKPEPITTEPLTGEEDSAQIAKKIKGLLSLKVKKPEEEATLPEVAPVLEPQPAPKVEPKEEPVRPAPPSSTPGELRTLFHTKHFFYECCFYFNWRVKAFTAL